VLSRTLCERARGKITLDSSIRCLGQEGRSIDTVHPADVRQTARSTQGLCFERRAAHRAFFVTALFCALSCREIGGITRRKPLRGDWPSGTGWSPNGAGIRHRAVAGRIAQCARFGFGEYLNVSEMFIVRSSLGSRYVRMSTVMSDLHRYRRL
jgi:hypothetical protein